MAAQIVLNDHQGILTPFYYLYILSPSEAKVKTFRVFLAICTLKKAEFCWLCHTKKQGEIALFPA